MIWLKLLCVAAGGGTGACLRHGLIYLFRRCIRSRHRFNQQNSQIHAVVDVRDPPSTGLIVTTSRQLILCIDLVVGVDLVLPVVAVAGIGHVAERLCFPPKSIPEGMTLPDPPICLDYSAQNDDWSLGHDARGALPGLCNEAD